MYVIRMPSEGRRSADYERGSRHSKKEIFHDTVLSFGAALVRRQISLFVTIPKKRFCSLIRIKSLKMINGPATQWTYWEGSPV
jgi:hypothetical protein